MLMERKGADILIYPASFSALTGPLHFTSLGIARALDTQTFVCLNSASQNLSDKLHTTWGHSMIINPNGLVVAASELGEELVTYDIDLDFIQKQRRGFPFKDQRRHDFYELIEKRVY